MSKLRKEIVGLDREAAKLRSGAEGGVPGYWAGKRARYTWSGLDASGDERGSSCTSAEECFREARAEGVTTDFTIYDSEESRTVRAAGPLDRAQASGRRTPPNVRTYAGRPGEPRVTIPDREPHEDCIRDESGRCVERGGAHDYVPTVLDDEAARAATARLRRDLFGEAGRARPTAHQPTDAVALRQQAAQLRELAKCGMKPRAYARKAAELDARADILEASPEDRIPHGIPGSCGHCAFWSNDPEALRAHRETCTWREAFFQSGGTRPPWPFG